MKYLDKENARLLMNRWGATHEDFMFVIDYNQELCFLCLLDEINPLEVLFHFPTAKNDEGMFVSPIQSVDWSVSPESPVSYRRKFDMIQRHLHMGNSFLANLTCKFPLETNLSLLDIYAHSSALYKLYIKEKLVCFSPEIFIRIKGGVIHSYPMKGTISADVPNAVEVLMSDKKEAAEHATIVDLIRNDLSIVADNVHVERYRYIDCLHTNKGPILQTSSDVQGCLDGDYLSRLGDIIFAQLPAGSITGAPKQKTMEIIQEAEGYKRGFYTGIMGICKGGDVDSAVMIRYVEQEDDQLYFKAGGGITAQSNWEDEYNEVIQKAYVPIC